MEYETRSYADVGELMHMVMDRVLADGWEPDVIVSVERGGRIPADMALVRANTSCHAQAGLARVTASKYDERGNAVCNACVSDSTDIRLDGGRVLIVDDVLETGDTMRAVLLALEGRGASDVRIAVPFKKESYAGDEVMGRRTYFGEAVPDGTWIVPEWEEETAYRREAASA